MSGSISSSTNLISNAKSALEERGRLRESTVDASFSRGFAVSVLKGQDVVF